MPSTLTPKVLLPDSSNSPPSRLTGLFNRLQPHPDTIVLILAVVIGGGAGLGVLTFRYLIEFVHRLALEDLMGTIGHFGAWTLACVPTLGGVLVGLIRWLTKEFSPGISALIAAVQAGKEMSATRPIAKTIAAAISLGTGASLGPEGPSVEVGANFGLFVGQLLKVSRDRQRLLLGAGAAAGLAAGFNAPIAGVFFALEVVLGTTFETSAASIVLLSAVVSALIAQIGLGGQPAFDLPAYEVRSPLELPLYLGLGLFACVVSIAYTNLLKCSSDFFKGKLPGSSWMAKVPREVQPILGGLCVGVVALKLPQILGVGYDTVEAMLRDVQFSLVLLITLLVVKLLLTAISLGSGLVGGIFAPAMFLGASLGAAYGKVLPSVLPMFATSIAAPPAYAMVGMAAVLAASVNAPLTAILLLFEMTRDYRIVLPLMAAVGLSVWLVNLFKSSPEQPSNLQQIEAKRDPDQVPNSTLYQQEILRNLLVAEAMQPGFLQVAELTPLLEAGLQLIQHQTHSALVVNDDRHLIGIITLQDINRAIARWETEPHHAEQGLSQRTIAEVCTTDILYAYQDEPLTDALDRMATRGLHQLPVIDRANPDHVLGLLEQEGITLACNLALTRVRLMPYLPHTEEANPIKTGLAPEFGVLN
ncbi:chloride channel protein [Leptolyngbya sp. DQ-M1]|uniref:chloride channel protein n=1 Tax=Leptolyngbya sp. DQ-M1 TaxID=2933920 RepID=UPI0032980D4F